MPAIKDLLVTKFSALFAKINPISSIEERATLENQVAQILEEFIAYVELVRDDEECPLYAALINAIWIIEQIERNLTKNINNCNFDRIKEQITILNRNGFSTFDIINFYASMCTVNPKVYCIEHKVHHDYSISNLRKKNIFDFVSDGVNDLMMLMVITRSSDLAMVPTDLSKATILKHIHLDLLIKSVLYMSIAINQDQIVDDKVFVSQFAIRQHIQNLLLEEAELVIKAVRMGITYMQQFILRITDYKVLCVLERDREEFLKPYEQYIYSEYHQQRLLKDDSSSKTVDVQQSFEDILSTRTDSSCEVFVPTPPPSTKRVPRPVIHAFALGCAVGA